MKLFCCVCLFVVCKIEICIYMYIYIYIYISLSLSLSLSLLIDLLAPPGSSAAWGTTRPRAPAAPRERLVFNS